MLHVYRETAERQSNTTQHSTNPRAIVSGPQALVIPPQALAIPPQALAMYCAHKLEVVCGPGTIPRQHYLEECKQAYIASWSISITAFLSNSSGVNYIAGQMINTTVNTVYTWPL